MRASVGQVGGLAHRVRSLRWAQRCVSSASISRTNSGVSWYDDTTKLS